MNTLTVIERENKRVMTTAVLADEYGTTEKVISNNFNNNKIRYEEGKHYFCLEGNELKKFKSESENLGIAPNLNKLYLWTEKGAFLHAKSLNTDRAWEIYDVLVDTYFKKHEDLLEGLSSEMKAILVHDKKLQVVESKVNKLENTMVINHGQAKEIECARKSRAITILGGMKSNAYKELSGKVFRAIGHDYKEYFNINVYDNTPFARFHEAVEYLNNWVPDNNLQIEINMANRGAV